MGWLFGPPKCGICGKTAGCRGHENNKKPVRKNHVEAKQIKTAKGSVISTNVRTQKPTGNFKKNGFEFCGKCSSRIINGRHSGLCK